VGRVYRVAAENKEAVIQYLDEREMVTAVYKPAAVKARIPSGTVTARTYVADRGHPQYAGKLNLEEQARLVNQAVGQSGVNKDYVINTVDHLEEIGIYDGPLHDLKAMIAGD
jgi:cation transport protein ChaC